MPPAEIHVIGVDPGGTTGWARLTVPRKSVFGSQPSKILEWDAGQLYGNEDEQVSLLGSIVRETQSLAYLVGPALVIEGFEIRTNSRGPEVLAPVRIAAKIEYARHLGKLCDSQIVYQSASMAKSTVTDDRLKRWGFWLKGEEHARDALRHAITALRRARSNPDLRDEMWNPQARLGG